MNVNSVAIAVNTLLSSFISAKKLIKNSQNSCFGNEALVPLSLTLLQNPSEGEQEVQIIIKFVFSPYMASSKII